METAGFTNPSQQWCTHSSDLRTVRGGVFRGGNRCRPRLIGVVDTLKAFRSGDGIVLSPGAGLYKPHPISHQSAVGLGFLHRAGGVDAEGIHPQTQRSRPRFFVVEDIWKDF